MPGAYFMRLADVFVLLSCPVVLCGVDAWHRRRIIEAERLGHTRQTTGKPVAT